MMSVFERIWYAQYTYTLITFDKATILPFLVLSNWNSRLNFLIKFVILYFFYESYAHSDECMLLGFQIEFIETVLTTKSLLNNFNVFG